MNIRKLRKLADALNITVYSQGSDWIVSSYCPKNHINYTNQLGYNVRTEKEALTIALASEPTLLQIRAIDMDAYNELAN